MKKDKQKGNDSRAQPAAKRDRAKKTPGATSEKVSLYGVKFGDAIKQALSKPMPEGGWPQRKRRTYKRRDKPSSP